MTLDVKLIYFKDEKTFLLENIFPDFILTVSLVEFGEPVSTMLLNGTI